MKTELPSHAQRMSSLLATDKESVVCQVERRADDAGRVAGRRRESWAWGSSGTSGARAEDPTGGERTSKMLVMSVTLDVLKYTGWLNRSAFCQAGKEGVRRGARCRPGGGGPAAAQARHALEAGPALRAGGPGHARSAR